MSEHPSDTEQNSQPEIEPNGSVEPDEVSALRAERDALAEQLAQAKDQLLRTMAETQNVQRRMRQQAEQDRKFGGEALVRDLIPILDNFDRTLTAANSGASSEALLDGIRVVERQLHKALENHKVARIPAVGKQFDPVLHEALVTIDSHEHPDEMILDELEPGYIMHDRVIRPSRVRVAKRP